MDDNQQLPDENSPEALAIRSFIYNAIGQAPTAVTAEELRDVLRLNLAKMSFPSLRDKFVQVAVPKLSQRLTDLDATSNEDKITNAKEIDRMLFKNQCKAMFFSAGLAVVPKNTSLRQILNTRADLFQNQAANDAARMLKITFGERAASLQLPDRLRNETNAKVCEELKMPDLAVLIRRSMQPL